MLRFLQTFEVNVWFCIILFLESWEQMEGDNSTGCLLITANCGSVFEDVSA